MARKKQLIIPVFIPFGGCPHQCVFCDQTSITGEASLPAAHEVAATIESYLATWRGGGRKEVAFYGGSFTGLPEEVQREYLEIAHGYFEARRIDGLRVSTRPDYIRDDTGEFLKRYGVTTVELGAQSMDDEVLRLSGRKHDSLCTVNAVKALRRFAGVGLQFMPGLPGDTVESILETTRKIIALSPEFVRVYPTLVIKGTPLHRMYLNGGYVPWTLDEMVAVCREISALLKEAGIPIIRMGLHPSGGLAGNIISGPFHPSFRQLVENGPAARGRAAHGA